MIESPGEGEEEGEAPDEGQPPVAVTELGPDMERGGDHLVAGGAQDLTEVLTIVLKTCLKIGLTKAHKFPSVIIMVVFSSDTFENFSNLKILKACLVAIYGDGCHRVGGDKDGHTLGERYDGTHESSEWPVVQHQPDLNITFYESFNIADQTFLSNSNTTIIQQYISNVLASSR